MSQVRAVWKLWIPLAVLAVAGLVATPLARADAVYSVNLTFDNGAKFVGLIDFSNTLHSVTGVDGTLYGYANGSTTYEGKGYSDTFDTVSKGGTYLLGTLDGVTFEDAGWQVTTGIGRFKHTVTDYNSIILDFDVTNPSGMTLIFPNLTGVDRPDLLSGDFSALDKGDSHITLTPEPGSFLLLGTGLLGLAGIVRRKIGHRV